MMNQNNEFIGNDSCTKDRITTSYKKDPYPPFLYKNPKKLGGSYRLQLSITVLKLQ